MYRITIINHEIASDFSEEIVIIAKRGLNSTSIQHLQK